MLVVNYHTLLDINKDRCKSLLYFVVTYKGVFVQMVTCGLIYRIQEKLVSSTDVNKILLNSTIW